VLNRPFRAEAGPSLGPDPTGGLPPHPAPTPGLPESAAAESNIPTLACRPSQQLRSSNSRCSHNRRHRSRSGRSWSPTRLQPLTRRGIEYDSEQLADLEIYLAETRGADRSLDLAGSDPDYQFAHNFTKTLGNHDFVRLKDSPAGTEIHPPIAALDLISQGNTQRTSPGHSPTYPRTINTYTPWVLPLDAKKPEIARLRKLASSLYSAHPRYIRHIVVRSGRGRSLIDLDRPAPASLMGVGRGVSWFPRLGYPW